MDRILYKEANGDLTCRARDFDKVFQTLYAYEELEMTPEDIEQTMLRFSSFLMEMTGGRMSKTNYTVQAMVAEANDYQQRELDEIEKELEQVKAERDLLLQQLCEMAACDACKHEAKRAEEAPCFNCMYGPHVLSKEETQNNWEWKGA